MEDYRKLLPLEPPEGMTAWLKQDDVNEGCIKDAILYQRDRVIDPLTGIKKEMALCRCTACGESWYAELAKIQGKKWVGLWLNHGDLIRSGAETECPYCGRKVTAFYDKHIKNRTFTSRLQPWTFLDLKDAVAFINWEARYEISDSGADWDVHPRNVYILEADGKRKRYTTLARSGWSSLSPMEYIGEWFPVT